MVFKLNYLTHCHYYTIFETLQKFRTSKNVAGRGEEGGQCLLRFFAKEIFLKVK